MNGKCFPAIGIIVEDERQQRAATSLQNVSYVIEAHFEILDHRFEKKRPGTPP